VGQLTLVLGGARSGKSDYGERLAQSLSEDVLFVATADPADEEMATRIARHRRRRPAHWRTVEAPSRVAEAIAGETGRVVLLDCVTILVSNVILALGEALDQDAADSAVSTELDALLVAVQETDERHWIVISNEVGLGIVPDNRLARIYRDALGRANQRIASVARRVVYMIAGVPLIVKEGP
jgi:adenosylcobinamide kinase/adenosylcobinamide-phosphate guanylyltransferase